MPHNALHGYPEITPIRPEDRVARNAIDGLTSGVRFGLRQVGVNPPSPESVRMPAQQGRRLPRNSVLAQPTQRMGPSLSTMAPSGMGAGSRPSLLAAMRRLQGGSQPALPVSRDPRSIMNPYGRSVAKGQQPRKTLSVQPGLVPKNPAPAVPTRTHS